MDTIDTTIGLVILAGLVAAYLWFAQRSRLGALSLPCITLMTGVVYFYVMPAMAIASGHDAFFGQYLVSLKHVYIAVALYMAGAMLAWTLLARSFNGAPAAEAGAADRPMSQAIFVVLLLISLAGVAAEVALGNLSVVPADDAATPDDSGNLAFLNVAFDMLVPLTLVFLVRDRFGWKSLLATAIVIAIFLQVGFRFRILILLASALSAFLLMRRTRVRTIFVLLGAVAALMMVNAIGVARAYGRGLDLTRFDGMSVADSFGAYGGEIGIVFAAADVAENPPPRLITVEPWTVGFATLVPRALWPNKPTASYLSAYSNGFIGQGAEEAGIAAPQIVEMLLQFGWPGVPVLSFAYFAGVGLLASRLLRLGPEGQVAGLAMIPAFFGYYMQTRGYFAQILSDGLFMFGPLFLLYLRLGVRRSAGAVAA